MTGQLAAALDLTVMMYHYVRDPGDAAEAGSGIAGLPLVRFAEQLEELAQRHTIVSWPMVRAALHGDNALPPKACLLTFDDGLRDHYLNVFPLLRARGLSGLFFMLARRPGEGLPLAFKLHFLMAAMGYERFRDVIWQELDAQKKEICLQAEPGYPQRWGPAGVFKAVLQRDLSDVVEPLLSRLIAAEIGSEVELAGSLFVSQDQAREMAAGGMHCGGHSHRHPWFDWIGPEPLQAEIAASANWLAEVEPGPWAFAYPYGGLNPAAAGVLAAHKFAAAFTTVEQTRHTDAYLIGRLDGEAMLIAPSGKSYA
jgi:peptidoglycan/xylan/chitin deacetylase (PgdA/CDA1 family)